MSQEVMGYFISTLTPILVGGVGISVRILIMWMRAQKNVTLHTLGELAYNEVQSNFTGVAGEQKMKIAIEKVRARLINTPWKNIDDDAIIKALQKAWYNQEGQYKNTSQTTTVLQQVDVAQPVVVIPADANIMVGQTIVTPEPSIIVPESSIVVPEPSIVTPMQPVVVPQPAVAPQTLVPSSQPAVIAQPSTVAPQQVSTQVTTGTPLNQILSDVNATGTGAANALQPTVTVVGPERTY
jgi:hypothetical protein